MNEQRFDELFAALQEAQDPCKMIAVLSLLPDDDLHAVHEEVLDQYGEELASGALERSELVCGNLVINANQPPICFLRTALDVVRNEMDKRKATAVAGRPAEIVN